MQLQVQLFSCRTHSLVGFAVIEPTFHPHPYLGYLFVSVFRDFCLVCLLLFH